MITTLEELEKCEVKKILREAEIPINWIGYKYIISSIPIIISEWENSFFSMRNIYLKVAKKHKTTAKKVEFAIRYVIDNSRISDFLGCEKKLSSKRLLILLADNIMLKLGI